MDLYKKAIFSISFNNSEIWKIDNKEAFGIMLSAPSCYVRGWNLNYIEIDNVDYGQIETLLKRACVSGRKTLLKTIEESVALGVGNDYEQFTSFWRNMPCFDIEQLESNGKKAFLSCIDYAEKLRLFVGDRGFWAWDYSETIQFIRMGFMKKWIKYDEANKLLLKIVDKSIEKYSSWKEFAISYICGGTYFMYKSSEFNEEKAERFFGVLCSIVQEIVSDNEEMYWH